MIERTEAERVREALREVVAQIDGGEVEATRAERAYISGAVAALDPDESSPVAD